MLRSVAIGVAVMVAGGFAYVGYNSYSMSKRTYAQDPFSGNSAAAEKPPPAVRDPGIPAETEAAQPGETAPPGQSRQAPDSAPATDTISPDPPNGMTFGGSGHYQLYRQGDLTWRLNTETGETCVLFATDEEWRKAKVYKAGCRGKE